MESSVFDNIRVVLVEPSHPGNIGAVARAMKTMRLKHLYLVKPADYPCAEATARASGADDVLYAAQVVESLPQAVSDCVLTVGASARRRGIPWPELGVREWAERTIEVAASAEVALVLGRENSGLSNDELERCNFLVRIPANPQYSSLNVAAAAQVLCHEIHMAALGDLGRKKENADQRQVATAAEVESMTIHLR